MRTFLLAAAVGLVLSCGVLAQAADPILGTWELNVAKSKFVSSPPPKSETRSYVQAGQDIKATSTTVDADGKTTNGAWTVSYDGKDRPEAGHPDADSLSFTRTDPYHGIATEKKNGKVVMTTTRVISPDGKTMTFTVKGMNGKGQAVSDVIVFEKR